MTDDLNVLREILLEKGVVPKVYLKGLTRPRRLAWQGIVAHEVADRKWTTIKRLLECVGFEWRTMAGAGRYSVLRNRPYAPSAELCGNRLPIRSEAGACARPAARFQAKRSITSEP